MEYGVDIYTVAVVERAPILHSSGFNEVFWGCSGLDALVFAVKSPPFVDLIIPLIFFLHILVLQNIEAEQYTSTSERNEGASRKNIRRLARTGDEESRKGRPFTALPGFLPCSPRSL